MKIPLEHYVAGETLYNQIVAPVCEAFSLTYMEFTVILFLANNPQYQTATQIAQVRRLTKSHVSLAVGRLQERGLLRGTHHEGDRRTIYLEVTAAAEQIVEQGRLAQADFQQALFAGFSPEEEVQLSQYMARIDRNIEHRMSELKKERNANHGTK